MAGIENEGGKRNTKNNGKKNILSFFSLRQKKVISKTAEGSRL